MEQGHLGAVPPWLSLLHGTSKLHGPHVHALVTNDHTSAKKALTVLFSLVPFPDNNTCGYPIFCLGRELGEMARPKHVGAPGVGATVGQ